MPCSVCTHAEVGAMVEALTSASLREVAERYGVSKSTLARHTKVCPTVLPSMGQVRNTVPTMEQHAVPAHTGSRPVQALVNAAAHHQALQLAAAAMQCYEVGGLRHVVRQLAELVAQVVRDAGDSETTAPQADPPHQQWNRL